MSSMPGRDADQAVGEPDRLPALRRHRGVGHRRRVADERLDAAEALGQRHQLEAVEHRRASSNDPTSNDSMPPKPFGICGAPARAAGGPAGPGRSPSSPSGASRGTRASARPLLECCAIRSASVLVPRSTSHESNGLRIAPAAFWMNFSHSMSSSRDADDDAADRVAVAVEVLRRAVHDDVGAERERPLQARARERVVDDERRAARVRQSRPPPRCR